ncbi:MAG: hypothetical protein F6K40_08800 [Okeania sp. SIO3I5]|uniref:hypothetical protein n=1 Tax=Okeania sp. SIO3I5 TaxID=2607805 RepID=UPI0013B681C8|nr:hypothetical protein [Okeania sp. SIO3I5]NEQ36368.1 hypothetical protein [Okeania sp. SIO3I5]
MTDGFHQQEQFDYQNLSMGLGENSDFSQNNFSLDNLANQERVISDNSALLNNDNFSSSSDDINQDLNQNLTDGFHQQEQFDYQNLSMGLGENSDFSQNNFSLDNLANQERVISDNSALLNNDNFSSSSDDINQDLNQNLTDGFHQQEQFDYQNLSMGLGENSDFSQNNFSLDNLANQERVISDNSGLLNNDNFSSSSDAINQDLKQNLTDGFHQQEQFNYQNSSMDLGENPHLAQNNFLFDNLANQDNSLSDNSGLLNNDNFSSSSDEINQDLSQNLTDGFHQQEQFDYQNSSMGLGENSDFSQNHFSSDNFHQQQQFEHQNFGTDFSGVNSESPLPEISNFQHEQNNLSLNSHTFESQNISLSSHRLEFDSSSDQYPYTTINNSGDIYLHTTNNHNGYCAGHVKGREVYNSGYNYLGYAGTDGKVYDNHNHAVGWVGSNGNVYNNGGIKVHHTNLGVVGGAAYLLCSYYGGVN